MDKLNLDLNLPLMDDDHDNYINVLSTSKENGFLLFGVRLTTETEGDGGNKSESKIDVCLSRDNHSLISPKSDPALSITSNSIMDKLTQLSLGSSSMNNNNERNCIEVIDNPIEGVPRKERFKMTRNAKIVHEHCIKDAESHCSGGAADAATENRIHQSNKLIRRTEDDHPINICDVVDTSSSIHRRKKLGKPWTKNEHKMFLLGLQKLGKGDWRGISRNFVHTRTPTQVAAHAQKYYIRQSNYSRRKRRSSLFDLISKEDKEYNDDKGDDENDNGGGGDGDNNGGGGGGGDNGGSGGGKRNEKDDGGDGNGDAGDKHEGNSGGGAKSKGLKMDSMGQPGFDYRYGYHAGSEFEYPVGQLQALQIFHHENLIQNIPLKGVMDMSMNNYQDRKAFTNTSIRLKERLKRTRNDNSVYSGENNETNDNDGDGDHSDRNSGCGEFKRYKMDIIGQQLELDCRYRYQAGYENRHPFVGLQCAGKVQ